MKNVKENEEACISKISELTKIIGELIRSKDVKLPSTINYSKGFDHPKYKITVEEIHQDYFVDSRGIKWVKAGS